MSLCYGCLYMLYVCDEAGAHGLALVLALVLALALALAVPCWCPWSH